MIQITNEDNMELMARYEDNYFDLAIVDPPYGIGIGKIKKWATSKKCLAKSNEYKTGDWDNAIPDKDFFIELQRVSKNQIIWGGNYFTDFLYINRCWLAWDKIQDLDQFSDFELAWTSFNKVCKKFKRGSKGGFLTNNTIDHKIHPTQKPVDLYRWQLQNYAKQGDLILDTHGGSMSIAIACDKEGFDLDICEIDNKYFETGQKRYNEFKQQVTMF